MPGIDQTEPLDHAPHELEHRLQQPGIGGERDAGDLLLRRCTCLGHKQPFFEPTIRTTNAIFSSLAGKGQTRGGRYEPVVRNRCSSKKHHEEFWNRQTVTFVVTIRRRPRVMVAADAHQEERRTTLTKYEHSMRAVGA